MQNAPFEGFFSLSNHSYTSVGWEKAHSWWCFFPWGPCRCAAACLDKTYAYLSASLIILKKLHYYIFETRKSKMRVYSKKRLFNIRNSNHILCPRIYSAFLNRNSWKEGNISSYKPVYLKMWYRSLFLTPFTVTHHITKASLKIKKRPGDSQARNHVVF